MEQTALCQTEYHPTGFFVGAFRSETVALKMTDREVDGTSVVTLDGRIVLGEESKSLREKLKDLVAEGKKQIVLNLDNVTYIDSAGLGILVAAHVSAKTQGASLKLCNLGRNFQELLQLTKLLMVFEVCNTEVRLPRLSGTGTIYSKALGCKLLK